MLLYLSTSKLAECAGCFEQKDKLNQAFLRPARVDARKCRPASQLKNTDLRCMAGWKTDQAQADSD
eukprot:COSAG01_NODE_36636_length_514_cov_2.106024_1_plen_66_part_00